MADAVVPLLDRSEAWTHRERHQHHRFDIHVPEDTVEVRLRFGWGPRDLGSEQLGNGLSLSLFGPDGFRGSANRSAGDQDIRITESDAPPGFLVGPIAAGTWTIVIGAGEILNDGVETGELTYHLEATATIAGPGRPPRDRGHDRRPALPAGTGAISTPTPSTAMARSRSRTGSVARWNVVRTFSRSPITTP